MKRISETLARKGIQVITVTPDTTVLEALKIMAQHNIGSLVVAAAGIYQGIITERDYSRKVILKGKHSSETLVAEIMTENLPQVAPSDTIDYCMSLMTELTIRYLPVFENGAIAGIISMSDVVKATIIEQKETINHLENYIQGQG